MRFVLTHTWFYIVSFTWHQFVIQSGSMLIILEYKWLMLVGWSVCNNIYFDSTSKQKLILINDPVKAFFSANHIHVFYSYYISQSHSFIFIGLFLFLFLLLFSVVLSINLKLTRASSYLVAWVTEKKYESEEIWVWRNMSL